ncbi:MAG: hypothetical protein P4M07_26325, partial [Xanthobacteraceae bacterium]|nr:hypothetical protein [Xanthobacteraceae bacterium]
RFALALAGDGARLGASAVRYTFTAEDFHLLLLAGLTGAQPGIHTPCGWIDPWRQFARPH